jgi:hypothetical protein
VGEVGAALLAIGLVVADADTPARRLPAVTTVCRATDATRCWTEPGESRCASGAVFRIVIDEPGRSDVAQALADCRKPSDAPRSQ